MNIFYQLFDQDAIPKQVVYELVVHEIYLKANTFPCRCITKQTTLIFLPVAC